MAVAGWNAAAVRSGTGYGRSAPDLSTKRTARVLFCVFREHLVALHGFTKKARPRLKSRQLRTKNCGNVLDRCVHSQRWQ